MNDPRQTTSMKALKEEILRDCPCRQNNDGVTLLNALKAIAGFEIRAHQLQQKVYKLEEEVKELKLKCW